MEALVTFPSLAWSCAGSIPALGLTTGGGVEMGRKPTVAPNNKMPNKGVGQIRCDVCGRRITIRESASWGNFCPKCRRAAREEE